MQLTKWVNEPSIWISKVKVIHWPWSKVTQIQHFLNFFSLETAGPIEAKFNTEPPWDVGTKVCSNNLGHVTKMAAMPINLLLLNPKAHGLETWYAASGTQVLPNSTDDHELTLSYFTAWSNLVPFAFVWGKFDDFSRNYCSLWYQVGRSSQSNEYMKL